MIKLGGACHCGNIGVDLALPNPAEHYQPRVCDCDFCRQHGAAYLSDPAGALSISVKDPRLLGRYRQGSAIADCLFCRHCGVLVGISYQDGEQLFATVNWRVLEKQTGFGAPLAVSPKTLSAAEKVERWKSVWFSRVALLPPGA